MTRKEALERIYAPDTEIRLEAARFFSTEALTEDAAMLRQLEKAETVPWIQRALRIGCDRLAAPDQPMGEKPASEDASETEASIYSKVVRDVSSRILHEIAPLIGGLMASAPAEVGNYDASQTKRLITQLSLRSEALRNMRTATATPKFDEIDLASLVAELVAAQPDIGGTEIIITGPEQFLVSADEAQLEMALSNGLRNALEAVAAQVGQRAQVVISWGYTAHENWLFVKDNGPGLTHPPAELLQDGISSKVGHSGYGLSLAREAMVSMQGELLLRPDEDGTHFELRWYRKNENPIC
ncbi:sensor histidine kinase [Sphingomonas solaris]|uniref:Histidine kinase domain-containing protein n=1 Tax=Alterirhizorhabdus solaris TaxID=2529389 RepID=A0A558R9G7_9SPHN|nr:sensor histidine kinase [Sphingomonas solaris]TVV76033.1 hypothetical protein FOY91_05485 [Sphingomonas solaris]